MRKLWEKWKIVSARILDKEATLILALLYIILVSPLAIIYRLLADPLNLKSKGKSYWFEKDTDNVTNLEAMKKQY